MNARRKISSVRAVLLLSVRRPAGHRLLLDFLQGIENGTIPENPTTAALARAFERIVLDRAEPLSALKLKPLKGRPRKGSRISASDLKILEFLLPRADNITQAVRAAARKFRKEPRHIWRTWERNSGRARVQIAAADRKAQATSALIREASEIISRQQPVIEAYAATLTPEERAAYMDLPGQDCYRIAAKALTQK